MPSWPLGNKLAARTVTLRFHRQRDGRGVVRRVGRRRAAIHGVNHFVAGKVAETDRAVGAAVGNRRRQRRDGLLEKTDFRQRRFKTRTGDADAHLVGGHRRFQADEPAMTNGREVVGGNYFRCNPRRAVPRFDGERFNPLPAMIHRFPATKQHRT